MFVSYTPNLWERMFDFHENKVIPPKDDFQSSTSPAKSESWNNPIRQCFTVVVLHMIWDADNVVQTSLSTHLSSKHAEPVSTRWNNSAYKHKSTLETKHSFQSGITQLPSLMHFLAQHIQDHVAAQGRTPSASARWPASTPWSTRRASQSRGTDLQQQTLHLCLVLG